MTASRTETRGAGPPSIGEQEARRQLNAATAVLVAVIVGLIGFGVGWLVFSDSDEEANGSAETPAVVERWAEAWETRDADAFADVYALDGSFDGILAVGYQGRADIRSGIGEYWAVSGETSQQLEPAYVFVNGGGAVVIWNIVTTDESGDVERTQDVTSFEWDWDDEDLLRSTSMNW